MGEIRPEYLEQMRAFVDDGGKLDSRNAVDLLDTLEATRARMNVLVDAAGNVCRTAGLIVEGALANEANPETPDSEASYMFGMLNDAVEKVKVLRSAIRDIKRGPR